MLQRTRWNDRHDNRCRAPRAFEQQRLPARKVMSQAAPVFLVFGPSGSGKSSLGARMAQEFKFQHLEIDRFPEDGIDLEALRPEWDAFWHRREALPLSQVVDGRAQAIGCRGAVLTFPGNAVPSPAHLAAASIVGMTPVILYGEVSECLSAFLMREKSSGRDLGESHWRLNNTAAHSAFGASPLAPY